MTTPFKIFFLSLAVLSLSPKPSFGEGGSSSSGSILVDFNGFYFSDAATISSTNSASTRMFYDASLMVRITKKGELYMGWNYGGYDTTVTTGSDTETYASSQMGPRFLWFMNKGRNWSLAAAYNLVTTAAYKAGSAGTALKWRGTAIKADIGYVSWLNDTFAIGGKVNYNSASYIESSEDGNTYIQATNTRVHIYPSIYLGFQF
ncbi:MAG: hypothetical protein AB7F59_09435 [Bdellovibrionales bacterium]